MSGMCSAPDCLQEATQKCSGCKTAFYCGATCQKEQWPLHKKECKINRMLYDMEQKHEEEEAKKPVQKPRKTHCTGCNGKFKEDWLEVDQECPDCGYITCESCSCHDSKGTCYCQSSNFGYKYCDREPQTYHFGKGGRPYNGDYHPSKQGGYELNRDDLPEAFEDVPRACSTCGETVHCLKKEYRNWNNRYSFF
ncbi:hypothetical protein GALMADRAFT_59073 [Galerina marginata CBS 339.88]|uniref:MYND-type domain-containing protein n=1 Tax=Galerina marginata (strain CBS 339.88) TaxID=685588 RepID=A0A067TEX0_GALM3|nr:hypothetical protein GALMADRAFT_59073 [Galerina marginata CBS 339.88]